MKRQQIGFWGTKIALTALLAFYVAAFGAALFANAFQRRHFLGAAVCFFPLLYCAFGVWRRDLKSFVVLALLAPLQFFFGGVVFLWGAKWQGTWVCFWALILEIATILHNFQRRKKARSLTGK